MANQTTLLKKEPKEEATTSLYEDLPPIDHEYVCDMVVGTKCTDIRVGDILYFPRKHVHGLVRSPGTTGSKINQGKNPATVDISWIGYKGNYGPTVYSRQTKVKTSTLEELASRNHIKVIASIDIAAPHTLSKWIGDTSYRTERDTIEYADAAPRIKTTHQSFNRIFSVNKVSTFLKNPIVDHRKGGVVKGKGIFTAERPNGSITAALTINSVNARCGFDRETVEITRYASHPDATSDNNHTATWMLGKVCQWAALEGYDTIRTYAGTDGNKGSIYQAANFEHTGTANSEGNYNREGRENQSHIHDLERYEKQVSVDGENAERSLPRRAESRLDESDNRKKVTKTETTFATFESVKRSPANFQFTREDISDFKFARSKQADEYPDFSIKLQQLVAEQDPPFTLSNLSDTRREKLPAAAFGAVVNGTLVAALLVSGVQTTTESTAKVSGYTARETAFPEATARWLLTRARDWAPLSGFNKIVADGDKFTHIDGVNPTVPKGVGFDKISDSQTAYQFSLKP